MVQMSKVMVQRSEPITLKCTRSPPSPRIHELGTHDGGALHHIVPVVVAVRTKVHAAGDTRKWLLLPIANAAFCSFLLQCDLHTKTPQSMTPTPNTQSKVGLS